MRAGAKAGEFWHSLGWAAVFAVALAVGSRPPVEPPDREPVEPEPARGGARHSSLAAKWAWRGLIAVGLAAGSVVGLGAWYAQVRPPLVHLETVPSEILESRGLHLYRPPASYEPSMTADGAWNWDNPEYNRPTPVKEIALAQVETDGWAQGRCLCWVIVIDEVPAFPTGAHPPKEEVWWLAFVDARTGEYLYDAAGDMRAVSPR